MKIGAYQFAVSGNIVENMSAIDRAVHAAAEEKARLLVFPECALTGYPPIKIDSPHKINMGSVKQSLDVLQRLSSANDMYLFVGSVTEHENEYRNSILAFAPDGSTYAPYHKRALWGWDRDHFLPGSNDGIYDIDGYRIGVRICYEIRFPEYFRELYRAGTDLDIIAFCDVSDTDNMERYALFKAHLRTRAVENICPILSVNDISPYQTAPTAFFNENGTVIAELPRHCEGLLVSEYIVPEDSFGAKGRKIISNTLNACGSPIDL